MSRTFKLFLTLLAVGVLFGAISLGNAVRERTNNPPRQYNFKITDASGHVFYTDQAEIQDYNVRFINQNENPTFLCGNWTVELIGR